MKLFLVLSIITIGAFAADPVATREMDHADLRRQCFWSQNGGTLRFDVLTPSCTAEQCTYEKVSDFTGSHYSVSEANGTHYGTWMYPYPAPFWGFSFEKDRQRQRHECQQSVKDFCRGTLESITTKLGTFEACKTESKEGFDILTRWSVPYLPYDGTIRMELKGVRYDLSSHPVFKENLKWLPGVKVSESCFQVFGNRYCEGDTLMMARTLELVNFHQGYVLPELYRVDNVSSKNVRFTPASGLSQQPLNLDPRDIGMYAMQRKCARGICPGARVRVESDYFSCTYSPTEMLNPMRDHRASREFEFLGVIGRSNNYSEIWKLTKENGHAPYRIQFEGWPNSKDVISQNINGTQFKCKVELLK